MAKMVHPARSAITIARCEEQRQAAWPCFEQEPPLDRVGHRLGVAESTESGRRDCPTVLQQFRCSIRLDDSHVAALLLTANAPSSSNSASRNPVLKAPATNRGSARMRRCRSMFVSMPSID